MLVTETHSCTLLCKVSRLFGNHRPLNLQAILTCKVLNLATKGLQFTLNPVLAKCKTFFGPAKDIHTRFVFLKVLEYHKKKNEAQVKANRNSCKRKED